MAYGGKIQYDIGFNVDKSGLKDLQTQLSALAKTTPTELMKLNPGVFKDARTDAQKALYGIKQDLKAVQIAFNDAFNPTTGLMNLQKLNVALNQIGADKLSKSFSLLGQKGQDAFYQMTKSALTTNMQLKKTNTFLDKMGNTLINTLKWTFSSSLINRFVGAVQQAVGYVEHLDSSLNDIRIVTKKSADEMEVFGQRANDAAKALGKATTDYTEAALIYYQQGLSDEEVKARAETTLKAANVTGQATKTVSEQLTAVWNGFRVNAEQTEEYVDKLAAVAAMSASNLEELSTGMSKVASAAANLGVDIDQLNAQISTIVSVTRQAPESVGTALKTIYARISDLKLGENDEDGLGLGDVSGGLQKLGINVLDAQGELRDLGTVIEEVAGKWNTWTSAQQAAIAQLMAGKRQYNNLVALFSNWDMYTNAIETSRNATGELQKQQDIYMESTEAHLQQLKTEWEDFYDSLIDPKAINNLVDSISKLVKLLTNFVDGIGGGQNTLLMLGSTALRVFDKQIGHGISNMIDSFKRGRENAAQLKAQLDNIEFFKQTQQYQEIPAVKALINAQQKVSQYYGILSNEQINAANVIATQIGDAAQLQEQWENNVLVLKEYAKTVQEQQKIEEKSSAKQYQYKYTDDQGKKTTVDLSNTKDIIGSKKAQEALQQAFKRSRESANDFGKAIKTLTGIYTQNKTKAKDFKKSLKDVATSTQTAKDNFLKLNEQGLLKDINPAQLAEIEKSLNQLGTVKGPQEFNQAMKNLLANLEGVDPAIQNAILGLEKLNIKGKKDFLSGANKSLDEFLKKAAQQQLVTNIVSGIAAVGQFSSAITTLTNGFKVLGDETLSTGEKILQFLTSFGFGIGLFVSSGSKIVSTFTAINGAINGLNVTKAATIIENSKLFASEEMLTDEGLKAIGVNTAQMTSEQILTAKTDEHNLALARQIALRSVLNPLTLAAIAGIAALVIGITALVSHYQEIRQEAIDRNKNIIEEVNKTQELIDKNKELADSYQDLIDQYKEGTIAQKEFLEQKQKIISAMDAEGQAALNTARNWEQAQKALDDYNKRQAEKQKEEQNKKRNAALELGFDAMSAGYGSYDEDTGTFSYSKSMGIKTNESLSDRDKEYIKVLQDAGFLTSTADDQGNISYTLDFTLTADDAGFEKLQELQKIQDQFAGQISSNADNIYKNIKYQFDELKKGEGYQDLEDSLKAISEADLQIAISESQINIQEDLEGLAQSQKSFIESLVATGYSTDEALTEWIKVLGDNGGKAQLELQQRLIDLRTMTQEYFKNFKGDIANTEKYGQIENIYDILLGQGFTSEQITALGTEYWKNIVSALEQGDEESGLVEQISNDLTNATLQSMEQMREGIQEKSNEISSSVGKSISDAIAGNLDVTSEDFTKLLSTLDEVKQAYPELTNEIETFSDQGLIGTEHWIQATYDLQDALDKIEFENLITKSKEAKEKLTTIVGDTPQEEVEIIADDEQFQEAMEEIMDANYQIDVEVHSDAERDFNQLVDAMKEADNLANKIGEDFIVAADDIRDLNNAFPGILEGIEYLGDGTVRLNEEIVQSAIYAANEQEAASAQELTTKLHNAATELRAKAEVYDSMANIAHQAATNQISSDQAKVQMAQKLDELETENDRIATQNEIDNATAVADNSNENARISAENWTKSYQQAADASFQFAQNAVANARAAAAGPNGAPVKSNFGFSYKGSNGSVSSEAKSATGFQSASTVGDWSNQEATYRNMAESARASANDIEGMIAGAAAKAQESLNKNNGVGKKKDSGSGKSSGGKSANKRDPIEREVDIYRKVNEELSTIGNQLDKIQAQGDHTWGASEIPILEKEVDLLNQQTEKLKEKNKLQTGDLSTRRKQLEMEGIEFTEDGSVMKNAEAVLNKLYADYNAKLEAMSAEEQEANKDKLDAEQERIKEVEKKVSEYESLYSDYEDILKQIQDNYYKKIELDVEKFTHDIEIKLELNDAKKEWEDFWYDVIKDVDDADFGGKVAKSFSKLDTLIGVNGNSDNDAALILEQLTGLNTEAKKQTQGKDNLFGADTALSQEKLTEYRDKLMQTLRDAQSALNEISDTYLDALNSEQELIDKQLEGWENIDKELSHNIDLIKLMNPENNFDALEKQYQQQYENNLQTVDANKKAQDHWKERVEYYKRAMSTVKEGTVEWETLNESYKIATENYVAATESLNSAIEKALEDLREQTENAVQKAYDMLDRAMSGGLGLEVIEDEWKLINDEANKYYDNIERYLNMEEYANILEDAANAIGLSAENQKKLNEFRDQELKQLSEKERLTEYDIEESKARLEIMKAQMALEDAQRNKSNMRLRRDSQGNYNYQYVANENEVNDGENGVLTAKKEWYALVKKRYQETSQEIINMEKEQSNLLSKIRDAQLAGDEERERKYKEMYEKNAEAIRNMYAETEKNKRDLYDGTAIYFSNVENRILTQSKTTVRSLVDMWGENGEESFTKAAKEGIQAIDRAQEDWLTKSDKILTTAGVNYQKLRDEGIDPTKESLDAFVDSNDNMNKKLEETNKLLANDILPKLKSTEDAFTKIKTNAEKQIKSTNDILTTLSKKAISVKDDIDKMIKAANDANKITVQPKVSSGGDSGSGSTGGGGEGSTGLKTSGTQSTTQQTGYRLTVTDDKGGHTTTSYSDKNSFINEAIRKSIQGYKVSLLRLSDNKVLVVDPNEYYVARESKIKAFKSGGYTGEWGSGGKLAMLHEKELVLNSSDTKNILSAVELLRTLPFSALAQSIVDSSSNIAASFRSGANMSGIGERATNNETKSMVINADFSGVRSADEIYQALLELENYGLQNSYSVAPHANSSY